MLKMISGSFYIPKESRTNPRGDDAHFISVEKQTIGVADGVGGWHKKGVNPGKYARKLVSNFVKELEKSPNNVGLREILNEAYSKTVVDGSSTFCALRLENNSLHGLNVGDSGFMVIRDGVEVYKSLIQAHDFNHPYQLGKTGDQPSVATVYDVPVQAGDIVIVGTDGLFDNLFTNDVTSLVNMLREAGVEDADHVAITIADYAYFNSFDTITNTPFAEASMKNGRFHPGGKKDDITVIVALIVSN